MKVKYDVLVVGAGPAGSAAAIKCAENGLSTLLIEKGELGRHKPCAGMLPPVATYTLDDLGLSLPDSVLSEPHELKVFYVPPSGRRNGGELRNYHLFNLDRDLFDRWLVEKAVEKGVNLQTNTTLLNLEQSSRLEAAVKTEGSIRGVKADYVIGADGVHSKVRRCLDAHTQDLLTVIQEYWCGEGEFEDCFYTILNEEITPTYGYVLEKKGKLLIGTAAEDPRQSAQSLEALKVWLKKEFNFKPNKLVKREVGFLPYGKCFIGCGKIMLVGDAAGLCNRFSGEGIRFALESGLAAAESICEAERSGIEAFKAYMQRIQPLIDLVEKTSHLIKQGDDRWREEFVATELKRSNLW